MTSVQHVSLTHPIIRIPVLCYAIISLLVIYCTRRRAARARQRKLEDDLAAQHGCLPMQAYTRAKLPYSLDLIKQLWDANADNRLLAFQQRFIDELGPNLEQRLLGDVGLVTVDPGNAEAILSRSKTRPGESDYFMGKRRDAFFPFLGEGIFTQDGPEWKKSRQSLQKQFARLGGQNLSIFREHVEELITKLGESDSIIDLQPFFFRYTLDTTTALLFGESAGSLHNAQDHFAKVWDEASWISALRVKLVDFYWLYTPRRYKTACDEIKAYADSYVQRARAVENDDEKGKERYAFVRSLHDDLQDPALVRDQLINVLLAGRDTTACMLSWTFRLLVRHPKVLDRLRHEIKLILGGDINITPSHIRQMPYLQNVVDEVLRLYPSVPINTRAAIEPTILPRGGGPDSNSPVLVRKHQGVGFSPYMMHRRKDLYGDDAREFRPERWEDGSLRNRIGWGYLPFNAGPRVCLGKDFALMEASYAIVRIVQTFPNMSLPEDEVNEPPGTEQQLLAMVVMPAHGCRVKLR